MLKLRAFLLLHTLSIVFKLRTSCLRTPNILFEKSEHLVLDMQNSSVASRVNLQRRAPSLGAFFVSLPQRRLYFSKNVTHSSSNSPTLLRTSPHKVGQPSQIIAHLSPLLPFFTQHIAPERVYFSLYSVKLSPKGCKVMLFLYICPR